MRTPDLVREPVDMSLLAGESVIHKDDDVTYLTPMGTRVKGRIVITSYRLSFNSVSARSPVQKDQPSNMQMWQFDLPLGMIAKVEKIGYAKATRKDVNYGIVIVCKDLRTFRFASHQETRSRRPLVQALMRYSFPNSCNLPLFAFQHASGSTRPISTNGWKLYDARKEMQRQGVNESPHWTIVDINENYKFADTYPRLLAVPTASANKDFLERVGEFRSRQRIPVLSWMNAETHATITRSSQPQTGISNRRNVDDERHLKNIMMANANCHQLTILDARPNVNAMVNRARGGGFEESYEGCALKFLDIQNIHVVRDSLKKMLSALLPRVDERNYLKLIDESKWLAHLKTILIGSNLLVKEIDHQMSVLVHCSDGWDRTAQLTALAELQLDGYYRTLEGFIVLIEKEWCSFGHKFGHRIGHGDEKVDGERSPIFVQFIDCVSQVIRQFPEEFEFTSNLLVLILDELFSCRYGTFLYNSEKQRIVDHKCNEKTISLWTYVLENRKQFVNPFFQTSESNKILLVNTSEPHVNVWLEYYARSNPNVLSPQSEVVRRTGLERALGRAALFEQIADMQEQIGEAV